MTAFTAAWSLLKGDPVFSVNDIRELRRRMKRERETGHYDVNRGQTNLERLMGIYPLRQLRFMNEGLENVNDGFLNAEIADKTFEEGYKKRMDTSPRPTPAKVVRIPDLYSDEYGQGVTYELQDEEGNKLSRVAGTEVGRENNRYGKHVKNASPMLVGLHGRTPREHQRKGYYQQLLNTILHNNMNILSTSRNANSQPFHESFQRRLPPSIDFEQLTLPYDDIETSQKYLYQANPIKQSKEREKYRAAGWGDLQPDYGVAPMFGEPEDERITNMKRDMAQGYQTQTRLDDKRFLPEYDVEHPRHRENYPYFRTKDGVPYSTNDVLQDLYNWDYSDHPYSRSLGELFG
tara:strand:- start:31834 stop:32874 length:1041 start_codon:yes stop_codon:yes gene_type:complete